MVLSMDLVILKYQKLNMISKENAKLLMIDLDIKNQKGVRVFSVRGTNSILDGILDVEMFVSSAMLSLIRLLPLVGNTESYFLKRFVN